MRVAVIGSGYVGLVAAACLAEIGHDVVCVDNDSARIARLQSGEVPIFEHHLPELIARHRGGRLRFQTELGPAVREAQAVFIAVGTPASEEGSADLSYVELVSRQLAEALEGYKVIVEKSTVPVYTSDWVRRTVARKAAADAQFDVVSNPEFLREGSAVTDFLYPDRIVVGADGPRAAEVMTELYAPLTSGEYGRRAGAVPRPAGAPDPSPLILTSAKSAEMIKHASNAFLAMKISFINMVARMCEAAGTDIEHVAAGIGTDRRIGRSFLRAGVGFGGSCFPKDLKAFRAVAEEMGLEFRLLDEVLRINEEQRQAFLRKVKGALWNLKGKRLAVLGLAFKAGTDDVRESPAIALVQSFLKEGAEVVAHDPAAIEAAKAEFAGLAPGARLSFVSSPYEAAEGADALVILTEWPEYARLDLDRIRKSLREPVLVDGRNLYRPEVVEGKGLTYVSVGRKSAKSPVATN